MVGNEVRKNPDSQGKNSGFCLKHNEDSCENFKQANDLNENCTSVNTLQLHEKNMEGGRGVESISVSHIRNNAGFEVAGGCPFILDVQ